MNQIPQQPMQQQPRTNTALRIGMGCAGGCLVLAVIGCLVAFFAWDRFVHWGIGTDLDEYHDMITKATTECSEKAEMLSIVEDLQQQSEAGDLHMDLLDWVDVDTAIRDMIEDGVIAPDECGPLLDELLAIRDHT